MKDPKVIKVYVQIVITGTLLFASLYVILFRDDPTLQKWATGIIGTVIGYWLK